MTVAIERKGDLAPDNQSARRNHISLGLQQIQMLEGNRLARFLFQTVYLRLEIRNGKSNSLNYHVHVRSEPDAIPQAHHDLDVHDLHDVNAIHDHGDVHDDQKQQNNLTRCSANNKKSRLDDVTTDGLPASLLPAQHTKPKRL